MSLTCISGIVTLCGAFAILLVQFCYRDLWKRPLTILLFHLIVADVISAVLYSLYVIADGFSVLQSVSKSTLNPILRLLNYSIYLTSFTLIAMSVERYRATKKASASTLRRQ